MKFSPSTLRLARLSRSLYGRRSFLSIAVGAFVGQLIWPMAKIAQAQPMSPTHTGQAQFDMTLRAVVDTLIPDDAITPSGSALGVDRQIVAEAQGQRRILTLLSGGCAWLDTEAGVAFSDLDSQTRIA